LSYERLEPIAAADLYRPTR